MKGMAEEAVSHSTRQLRGAVSLALYNKTSVGDLRTALQGLIDSKADINGIPDADQLFLPPQEKGTVLHQAAQYGNLEVTQMLLDLKANVNANMHEFAFTPLEWAARHHRNDGVSDLSSTMQLLVDNGATISKFYADKIHAILKLAGESAQHSAAAVDAPQE